MALKLIMLGPPGSGKGTQADRVVRRCGVPKISTGDLLREAGKAGTEVGLLAKALMDRGELVGDDVMIGIVRERLARPDASAGFVLDGFPRTVAQAGAFDLLMDRHEPLIIIDLVVPEEELVRRLGTRMICEDCGANAEGEAAALRCVRCGGKLKQRTDDNEAVVRERFKVYRRDTQPLTDYYRLRPTFRAVNGAQAPDLVEADLVRAIDDALGEVQQG